MQQKKNTQNSIKFQFSQKNNVNDNDIYFYYYSVDSGLWVLISSPLSIKSTVADKYWGGKEGSFTREDQWP